MMREVDPASGRARTLVIGRSQSTIHHNYAEFLQQCCPILGSTPTRLIHVNTVSVIALIDLSVVLISMLYWSFYYLSGLFASMLHWSFHLKVHLRYV